MNQVSIDKKVLILFFENKKEIEFLEFVKHVNIKFENAPGYGCFPVTDEKNLIIQYEENSFDLLKDQEKRQKFEEVLNQYLSSLSPKVYLLEVFYEKIDSE